MTAAPEYPAEPVLAIDFGTSYSAAYLAVPGRPMAPVLDPRNGSARWASAALAAGGELVVGTAAKERQRVEVENAYRSEFKRDLGPGAVPISLGGTRYQPQELMSALLGKIIAAAAGQLPPGGELGRTVLTVPAFHSRDRPLRELMFAVLEDLVPGPVQLLPEPVAAAWSLWEETDRAQSSLILVYDFGGGTFDTALVQIGPGDDWEVLDLDSEVVGGKDIDVDLARLLRRQAEGWLAAQLGQVTPQQARRLRYRFETAASAAAEQVKVELSRREVASARLDESMEPVPVTRRQLDDLARPHVQATIACYRRLLTAQQKSPADLSAVLLVGGSTKMRLVPAMVRDDLGPEIPPGRRAGFVIEPRSKQPELAVARGAARWAVRNPVCAVDPLPAAGGSVLRWPLDDPRWRGGAPARLMRWLHGPGQQRPYGAGDALARIRYGDGTLWDLVAAEPGALGQVLADPPQTPAGEENGVPVESRQWIATMERSPAEGAGHVQLR